MTQQTFRLAASGRHPSLFVRRQPRIGAPPVLYVHGATFPSALSVGFYFGDGSWLDDWNARGFDAWALDFDAVSRTPPAVRIPNGPRADNMDAWAGHLVWTSSELTRPLVIVRGAWDSLCTDADSAMLLSAATAAAQRHDRRLAVGTHLMHLETGWRILYEAVGRALKGEEP